MKLNVSRAIASYFQDNYAEYEREAEWYVDPDEYTWKFDIPSKKITVKLCYDVENEEVLEIKTAIRGE